ncbi:hypothetical protein FQA39_LY02336 [Lamprigera yunnana]|nr:hypothetical protein FQA39_LY02336 [Lamprigera yunnana]
MYLDYKMREDNKEVAHIKERIANRFLAFFAFIAAVNAASGYYPTSLHKTKIVRTPHYSFGYDVRNPSTDDFKDKFQTRKSNLVQGRYSVVDADVTKGVVSYVVDHYKHDFNAVISKTSVLPPISKIETVTPLDHHCEPTAVAPSYLYRSFLLCGPYSTYASVIL